MTAASSPACPRCRLPLTALLVGGVDTDVCEQCGGVWLDRLEIARFERPEQGFGEALVAHLQQFPTTLFDPTQRLACPRHADVTLQRRPYSARAPVQVDICPQCGGMWLDADELRDIRHRLAVPRG